MKTTLTTRLLRSCSFALTLASLPAAAQTSPSTADQAPSQRPSDEPITDSTTFDTRAAPATRTEATKDELRVSPEDARQEVTDAHKASKIIGTAVFNQQNERVGKIHELVIDTKTGKVAYAVLSAGGILGAGNKLIAVPLDTLTPRQGQQGFLINADKERLSQATGFSEKDWPKIDAALDSSVGLTPTGRPSAHSGRADTGPNAAPRSDAKPVPSPGPQTPPNSDAATSPLPANPDDPATSTSVNRGADPSDPTKQP